MGEFLKFIRKDTNIQSEISQAFEKYIKESFSTRSQTGQNALIQIKVFKRATIGETISYMDIELEQKDKKVQSLEAKIGIPDSKVIEEMNRLD